MERLIELKAKEGNPRFTCYLDKDLGKIKGKFTLDDFKKAVEDYLSSNYQRILKPLLEKRNIYTGQKLYNSQKQAVEAYLDYLISEYL